MLGLTLLLLSSLVICGEYLRYVYIPRRKKRLVDRILSDYAGSKRRRFLSARVYGWNIILVCPVDRGQRGTSRAREDEERENIFSLDILLSVSWVAEKNVITGKLIDVIANFLEMLYCSMSL